MLNMEKGDSPENKDKISSDELKIMHSNFIPPSPILYFHSHLINGPSNSSEVAKSLAITAAVEILKNTKQSRNAWQRILLHIFL